MVRPMYTSWFAPCGRESGQIGGILNILYPLTQMFQAALSLFPGLEYWAEIQQCHTFSTFFHNLQKYINYSKNLITLMQSSCRNHLSLWSSNRNAAEGDIDSSKASDRNADEPVVNTICQYHQHQYQILIYLIYTCISCFNQMLYTRHRLPYFKQRNYYFKLT